jgi:endonuclease/exonuclease/phosphatase family metal-dependent hydrolase
MRSLLLVPCLAGCAPTINLVQPNAPKFEGRYASAVPASARGSAVRVVTFNIRWSDHVDRAIEVLERPELEDADLIALQEMDDTGVDRIARAMGLNYVYFPATIHPLRHRYFGPALLSRWPIDSAWKVLLPHAGASRGQRRTATAATVRVRDTRLRVYAVHLETQTNLSPSEYLDQAAAVVTDAASSSDPVVVAGDFNGYDIGRYLEAKGYQWPTQRVGRTSFFFSLDHIFVRGLGVADSATAGSVRQRGASDHRPVWARIWLPTEAGGLRQ